MKINLNTSEVKFLKSFQQYYKGKLDKKWLENNGGLISTTGTYSVKSFVISFFAERGISVNVKEAEIYGFRSVGMHTDEIYEDGVETLIIPLKGRGVLNHFRNKKIREDRFNCANKSFDKTVWPLWLNQAEPHSFTSETDCYAILAGVDTESLKKLYEVI